MNKKTIIGTMIIIVLLGMGYLLYKFAVEEFENRSAAPYPLAEVQIENTVAPDPAQTMKTNTATFNVSPEFNIEPPVYSRLPMYEFVSTNRFTDEFAENLPNKLGLNTLSNRQDPVLGKTIIANNGSKNLVIYVEKGELNYTDSTPQSTTGNLNLGTDINDPNLTAYKTKAQSFIDSLGLTNAVLQYKSHSFVVANTDHIEVTSQPRSANMVQLTYEAKVENLSIIDSDSRLVPNTITIWMNSNKDIAKLFYQSTGTIGKSFGNYQLLNTDEIRKDLQTTTTKAKLVNGDYLIGSPIESINIMSAHIAYLSVENYLVPVYILEANVRTSDNHSGTGYLLLEAIKK